MHNKPHTEETKQKISLKKKEYYKTHPGWNKGKKGLWGANSGSFKKGVKNNPNGEFKKGSKGHWKGGRIKTWHGYISIYKPEHPFSNKQGRYSEHRIIVENILGRYLKPEEKVHHINGIKDDNRLENLILFVGQYAHKKFEMIQEGIKEGEIIFDGRNYKRE